MMRKKARRLDPDSLVPPGTDSDSERRLFRVALITACVVSLTCPYQIVDVYRSALRAMADSEEYLYRPAFFNLIMPSVGLFSAVICMAVGFGFVHYRAFFRESRSIYLMRRLPTQGELFRRVALLPLCMILLTLVVLTALYGGYYALYRWLL